MLTRSFLRAVVGKLQSLILKLRLVPGSREITYLKYALKMQKIASSAHLPVPKSTKRCIKRDEALTDLPHLLTLKVNTHANSFRTRKTKRPRAILKGALLRRRLRAGKN